MTEAKKTKKRPGRPTNEELKRRGEEERKNLEENFKTALRAIYELQKKGELDCRGELPLFFTPSRIYSQVHGGDRQIKDRTVNYLALGGERGYLERMGLGTYLGSKVTYQVGFRIKQEKLSEVEKLVSS